MNFNNMHVSSKLWLTNLGLMFMILVVAVWTQLRITGGMGDAMAKVDVLGNQLTLVLRWRGMVETALTYVVGGAVTTDPVLAKRYDAQFKELSGTIGTLQEQVIKGATSDEEKKFLEELSKLRATAVAHVGKAKEVKASDPAAVQDYVDKQLMPAITVYLAALDKFATMQDAAQTKAEQEAVALRQSSTEIGLISVVIVFGIGIAVTLLLTRSITQPLDAAVNMAGAIAGGDLTQEVHVTRGDEFGTLQKALSDMVGKLRSVVGEVRSGVDSVNSAANEIATGNADLSARTEQTAASLEETAASMEELTGTVTQSADTATQANQLAAGAAQAAQHGGDVVQQVVASMRQISESSRKINDIIGVIDGIAFQTNILALNAAVEAARAGEQGRGFAVVAGEVRSLAQRSAEAAKEIKGLITASVQTVDAGSAQVAQAGKSMEEIVGSVRRVSDLIGEITAAAAEQRDGINQVNAAVMNLDQMTQQNAALVEQSTAAATSMRDQAQRLAQVISVFNVGEHVGSVARPLSAVKQSASPPHAASAPAGPKVAARKIPAAASPAAPGGEHKVEAPRLAAAKAANEKDWETF